MLQNGRISRIDVGRCNEFIFLNTPGFGFDGLANKYAGEYQSFSGMLKYLLAALKANLHRCNIDVAIGNKPRADYRPLLMATVANGRVEGGSFRVAPHTHTGNLILSL